MKNIIICAATTAMIYLFGCNQVPEHDHELSETNHVHEEADTIYQHSAASQTHESENSAHMNEADAPTLEEENNSNIQAADDLSHDDEEIQVLILKKQDFNNILETTGVILPARENVHSYQAQSSGFIHFVNNLVQGWDVKKGDVLFEIQGGLLSDDNYYLNFQEARLEYEKQKKNFERASELIEERIISEEEFLEIETSYKNAESRYRIYLENRDQNGRKVLSKTNGYIHQIFVAEGEYVNAGEKLATVINRDKLILQADVPQTHFNVLGTFRSATFATPYSNRIYRSKNLNGRLLAYGRSTDESSFFTPVSFEIDYHPDLLPGSFVEIYLMGEPIANAIVLPKTALMEEQGRIYVFIHHEDGEYGKRYVEPGADDGEFIQILSGLEENQMVVVKGAYLVKLSTISTALPDTHSH
ncbi:MAG: efflux RND transporter periplasmic adaptor subunit [Bacteroidales bacterium]|nr:MAG: efflux RND transporter periplasmic adaptor subunit [Bacteroidales bacterium]